MPSPTSSTRPICSARGPSTAPASLVRACLSQPSARVLRSVVIREVSEDLCEIGTPTVAHDEVGAVQLQTGDEGRIRLEDDLRVGSERLADSLPIAFLVSRREWCRADRFEHAAVRRYGLSYRLRKSPDLLEKPGQERGPHRWAIETGGQAFRDFDRKAARLVGPYLAGHSFLLLDRRLCICFQGCRLLRGFVKARGPRLFRGFVRGGPDCLVFLRKARTRALDLGECRNLFAALRLRLRQNPLRQSAALLDYRRDRPPEKPL